MPTLPDLDLSCRLDELPDLLPFPAVALKLMDACNNADTGAQELCQIIQCDPSLSMELLRISNSSLYGCSGQIRTIEHAAVMLGVKGLRDLALSAAAAEVFCGNENQNLASQQLWHHSLGCATVARILAENVPEVSPEEAFVAGLVHDVGKLIFIEVLKDNYDLLPKALNGISTIEEEEQNYGCSHAELGRRCGEEWGLPGEISDAITYHHSADEAASTELASVVGVANQISKIWNIGTEGNVETEVGDVLEQNCLSFDEALIASMSERAPRDYAASKKAFGA